MSNRFKNYGLWVAVAALIALVLPIFGVKFDLGKYNEVVNGFLGILVLLGIINNPTTETKGFNDDPAPDKITNIPQ